MLRENLKLKKLLALTLSVCLMLVAVPIMNNDTALAWSFSEKEGYREDVTTLKSNQASIDKLLESSKGILYGAVPYNYNYSSNKWDACPSFKNATDGVWNEFYPYTGLYSYTTFQLDDIYNLTEFGLILKNANLRNSYEVYVGNDYATLYTGTPVYVFDGTAEGYTSSMGQYVQFTADANGALPQGSIIGIKFTECMDSKGVIATANRAVRVAEIYANGTHTNQDVAGMALTLKTYDQKYYNYQSISNDNLLKHASLHAYTGMDKYNAAKASGYYDGDPLTESYISNTIENPSITFALRAETEISAFRMYQSNANYRATYKIYVGNDADNLYSEENMIYSWDGAASTEQVQEYYFNANRKTGKFFGIYFDDTTNSESVPWGIRIAEIFIDGKELDTETYNSDRNTVEARISSANNLLKGKEPTVKLSKSTSAKTYNYTAGNNWPYLNDGTVLATKHCDLYGYDKDYILLVYDLGGTARVDGFELYNRAAAQNSSYEVYVGNSTNDILNENNLAYTYDGSTDISGSYRSQYVHFAVPKVGSYIAIKLTDTYGMNSETRNFRIAEIAAYGEVTEPASYALYSTRNVTSFADTNLLHGLTAELTGSSAGESGWDTSLTDGVVNSKIDLTSVITGKTCLTYDIGYTAVIDKFVVGQQGGYETGIEYYVSHDKDTLYDAANLVATYDINELFSANENHDASVVFAGGSKPVGRYVGLRVVFLSGNETRMRLYEISAIGGKAPMELTPHNYEGFNTGFEEGDSATGIGGTSYTENAENIHEGSASRLHAAGANAAEWLVEDYNLIAGRTYDISFWYKADNGTSVGSVNGNALVGNGEWKQYTETVTTDKEGALAINLNAAEADVYLDDISIVPVITVINDGVVGGTGEVNITTNDEGKKVATFTATRDFGYDLQHWTDMAGNVVSEDATYVATNPWPGYTLKPVFEKQQSAFDFEDENIITSDDAAWYTPETEGFTYKFVYSGNKSIKYSVNAQGDVIALPVDLAAGTSYTVSFKYIAQTQSASVSAAIGLNGTTVETVALSAADEWQTCTAEITTAADSDEITLVISGDSAVYYIDDICVEPTADEGKITVSVGAAQNGNASASDSKIVAEKPVKFTAKANSGYVFDKWINAAGETVSHNSTFVMLGITEDVTLTPVFVKVTDDTATYGFETPSNGKMEGIAEFYTPTTYGYNNEYVHWGNNSIRMDGYGSSYTYSYVLKAGQDYRLAFWYLLPESTSATINFTLGDTTYAGCTAKGIWNERFCKLTPTEDMQLTITVSGGAGPVYIDDIIIEPYHTVSVDDAISRYVSVSTVEPLHGDTITASVKRAVGEHELFYGWLKNGVLTEAATYDVEFTITEDLVIDEALIGTPVYVNRYDTNNDGVQNIADLVYATRKSESGYVLGSDIDRSGAIDNDDFKVLRTKLLGYEIASERDAYLSQEKHTITGSSDDLTTWMYELGDTNVIVREAVFDSGKNNGEIVEIVQLTDVHFTELNDRDIAEANPTVLSTWDKEPSKDPAKRVRNASICMEYANYFYDQTVITGDILSFLTWGGIEQIKNTLWGKDPSAMITLGNHDMMMRSQGLVGETVQLESRYSTLQENWRHDAYYTSRVIKDKVMVVQMDNALSRYSEEQYEKLAADIEKARENGYIILIFQHVPIVTNNPEYKEIRPIYTNDSSIVYDFSANTDSNGKNFDGVRTNKDATTTKVYNLITQNADVIKGLFCGHYHDDFYCEVKATEKDGTETVIPQYVVESTAFDSGKGHVMKITVK
ncbi:MAG: hypothetical protein IKL44_05685 [Clostridia bacterium]|nr:hypothetical protein [Clostridia bacterium]